MTRHSQSHLCQRYCAGIVRSIAETGINRKVRLNCALQIKLAKTCNHHLCVGMRFLHFPPRFLHAHASPSTFNTAEGRAGVGQGLQAELLVACRGAGPLQSAPRSDSLTQAGGHHPYHTAYMRHAHRHSVCNLAVRLPQTKRR